MREMQFIYVQTMVMSVFSRRLQNSAVSNWTCCMYSRDMKSHCRSCQSLYFRSLPEQKIIYIYQTICKSISTFLEIILTNSADIVDPKHARKPLWILHCTGIPTDPLYNRIDSRHEKVIRGHVWTSVNHVNRNCLLHMLWFWQHHTLLFSNRSKRPAFVYKQIQQSAGIQPCFGSICYTCTISIMNSLQFF